MCNRTNAEIVVCGERIHGKFQDRYRDEESVTNTVSVNGGGWVTIRTKGEFGDEIISYFDTDDVEVLYEIFKTARENARKTNS